MCYHNKKNQLNQINDKNYLKFIFGHKKHVQNYKTYTFIYYLKSEFNANGRICLDIVKKLKKAFRLLWLIAFL